MMGNLNYELEVHRGRVGGNEGFSIFLKNMSIKTKKGFE